MPLILTHESALLLDSRPVRDEVEGIFEALSDFFYSLNASVQPEPRLRGDRLQRIVRRIWIESNEWKRSALASDCEDLNVLGSAFPSLRFR